MRPSRGTKAHIDGKPESKRLALVGASWLSRLDPPAAVSHATSTYRISNDNIAGFIDDRCLLNPHMHVVSTDLWNAWEAWCHANSQRPGTNRMLKAAMELREVFVSRSNGRSRFKGIGLASMQD
jgi:phage/plasmid-associated DNA primase